jgi:large subunit ribosomal protein L2
LFLGDFVSTQIYLYKFYNKVLLGCRVSIKFLKKFTIFFNLNNPIKSNLNFACSSGTFCSFIQFFRDYDLVKVRLPSSKKFIVSGESFGTLGRNSNIYKKYRVLGSAKASKKLGKKPIVRGVAMNPFDHPHGGGEGKTSGGRPSVTPWGKLTKGQPTRNKKKFIRQFKPLKIINKQF